MLTLTATDSNNQVSSATVPVTLSGSSAAAGPTLSVGQSSILFIGQPGGQGPASQALSVRNLGGGSLNWSVSSDSAWLVASLLSGSGPTDLTVNVNSSGFLGGTTHVGHLTVTAPGAAASPQVVDVVVQIPGSPPERLFIPLVQR